MHPLFNVCNKYSNKAAAKTFHMVILRVCAPVQTEIGCSKLNKVYKCSKKKVELWNEKTDGSELSPLCSCGPLTKMLKLNIPLEECWFTLIYWTG